MLLVFLHVEDRKLCLYYFFLQETSLFPQYVPKVRQRFYLNFFLTIMRCINLHADSHLPTRYRADHLMISGTLERC